MLKVACSAQYHVVMNNNTLKQNQDSTVSNLCDSLVAQNVYDVIADLLQSSHIVPEQNHGGREKLTAEVHLLVTLWYLANQECFRAVADRFGVSESSALRAVRRITDWLRGLAHIFIRWPNVTKAKETERLFYERAHMPRVIGAIDGSHIAIQAPTHRADDYVNRKGVHSVILQAVVDPNMLFVDIYAGEPGSLHDARVLRKSPLFAKAQQQMGSLFHNASVLVGDAAYPCLPWLVTPFRDNGHLSQQQKEFNHAHSTTRIVVEQSFGLLKGCFRKLQHLCMTDVDEMPRVILACCVLHNICVSDGVETYHLTLPDDDSNSAEIGAACNTTDSVRHQIMSAMYGS